jgi:hypothetical protein
MKSYPIDFENDEVIPRSSFEDQVEVGCFIDYDGSGYYSDGKVYFRDEPAIPSIILKNGINPNFSHVVWFNK